MNIGTTQSSRDYYQEHARKTPPSEGHHHDLNPRGNIAKPVPRIKRPRSSKKTPATLLSADVHNFRTLVQQYTGCQRANSSLFKMASKGPINLNFATEERNDDNVKTISIGSNTTTSNGFGYNINDDYYQEDSQLMHEDHQTTFSSTRNISDDYYQGTSELMHEDHQTLGSTRMVSDISLPDLLNVVDDQNFMENTCFSWRQLSSVIDCVGMSSELVESKRK